MATLEFDQANHAILKIIDDEALDMVPFIAGVGHRRLLPSYTDYEFPDLHGTWLVVHEIPVSDDRQRLYSYTGRIEDFISHYPIDKKVGWTLWESDGPVEVYTTMDIMCRFNEQYPGFYDPHSDVVPDCWLSDIVDIPGNDQPINRLYFPVPYANIGASRISAVHPETGVRLTMYRLEYD